MSATGRAVTMMVQQHTTMARGRAFFIALVIVVCLGALTSPARPVAAHAELIHTAPAVDGVVPVAGSRIRLWYSQAIASSGGSPSVKVLDQRGRELRVTNVGVNASDPTEVDASIPSLPAGTYTVTWNVISSVDGHPLRGTYAFRVAGGLPAGAATTAGQTPAVWAVALRWLTFLGAALALGGCVFTLFIPRGQDTARGARRRARVILLGALVALAATVFEPALQTLLPSAGLQGSFLDVVRGQPMAWWLRPATLLPLVLLGLVVVYPLRGRLSAPLAGLGLALGAVALLGLALPGHGAGRASWRDVATVVDVGHVWAVALLVGGLVQFTFWRPPRPDTRVVTGARTSPDRSVSSVALVLFGLSVATGLGNAIFALPSLSAVWASDYGRILMVKVLVLLITVGLAIHGRRVLNHMVAAANLTLRRTVRFEVIALLAVVLGGSVLALSAPPAASQGPLPDLRLVAPALDANGRVQSLLHLAIEPAATGQNQLRFHLTDTADRPFAARVPPLLSAIFTSLTFGTVQAQVGAQPDPSHPGEYVINGLQLSLNDWWQIVVQIEISGETPTEGDFYVLMPDPNVHVAGPPSSTASDPAAQALYARGLENLRGLSRLRYSQAINTGRDQLISRQLAVVVDPRTGQTAASSATEAGQTRVTVGSRSWRQGADGRWRPSADAALAPMAAWNAIYGGGIGARLGITSQMNGESTRVVMFYRPRSGDRPPAWFAWWIGLKSGRVYRSAMVSDQQYVLQTNADFNGNVTIEPPSGA